MKTKITFGVIAILFAASYTSGQITITNATFPAEGDTLKTATDNTPDGVMITAPGGPYTWDFSMLNSDSKLTTVFQNASAGMASASYPNADLVVIGEAGGETYYQSTATAFRNLGISGSDILGGFMLDADLKFVPPLQERNAPLDYPSVSNTASNLAFTLALSSLPDGILDSLGFPSGLVDSIRIKLTIARADFVDAYGTLAIPGGTYDVLRSKRTDYTDMRIEVLTFLGWQDVTNLLPIDGFGRDTTISYHFINDVEKEPIAVASMDSTGMVATAVDFKDNGVTSAVEIIRPTIADIVVYPNPARTDAVLSFTNLDNGLYTLCLYNTFGVKLLNQNVSSGFEKIPIASFTSGMYLYHLFNHKGQLVASGKLVKI